MSIERNSGAPYVPSTEKVSPKPAKTPQGGTGVSDTGRQLPELRFTTSGSCYSECAEHATKIAQQFYGDAFKFMVLFEGASVKYYADEGTRVTKFEVEWATTTP